MWQRIQTIYLALSALLAGVSLSPVAYDISGEQALEMNDFVALMGLCVLVAVVSVATILMYKNRALQITLCWVILACLIGIIGLAAYYAWATIGSDVPYIGTVFPIVAMITTFLAMRSIRADERLIRSMDRLR
ncbi:MAG TPA: DUF4293 domain-containing protein [Chitinophagales bacterium]|nr:DUF4293 domain-containing protein [Chitinophagales bacterium]